MVGFAFEVHRLPGAGFLERVYRNALALEIHASGLAVQREAPLPVRCKGAVVGQYFADLIVQRQLVCEMKAGERLRTEHEVQLFSYLQATGTDFGLLLDFGRSVTIRRKFGQARPQSCQS